ncbi:hypothetical protein P3X46_028799 [Hevea brasiliensis]|uniref:Glycosyltransferase n=1 Tax=Hevea brasiliensis TaxID=3981 RepID=A0ABQ9KT59_HEVBR|nr:7-deoxyloganetin glucosyltransferase-like [Hevea brasiliensis]KAJ9146550.1 hypothetical protein P3X46_028799 [Hevea brasiliensis]
MSNYKPHAVCVPFALQTHINPLLKLAKLLHYNGFHITFVNTEFNHKHILESKGPNSLDGLPDFCFETLPIDHHPPSNTNVLQRLSSLRFQFTDNFLLTFRSLLAKLKSDCAFFNNRPPVTCIIADGFLSSAVIAAEELGIPCVLCWNVSASGLLSYIQYRQLMAKCVKLLTGEDHDKNDASYMDTIVEWLPGMEGITFRDLPNLIQTKDPISFMMDSSTGELERIKKASAHVCHTFEALEVDKLDALSSMLSQVYSIGPLDLLLNHIPKGPCLTISCNPLNEEVECIQWLNSKKPNSVIYVSFGTLMVSTSDKLVELAWGLANSMHNFLWIIRSDLVMGESTFLPHEFLLETKNRAFIASWCPQDQVLNHPSIGGFITHSGWNSTIESISSGIPMICWPFFGEHFVNCRNCCNEWGIGMELNNNFNKNDVEKLLRELMVTDKGKKMKTKAMEWKNMAEEAIGSLGSSSINFSKLVSDVLLASH